MATGISEQTRQRIAQAWPEFLARVAAGELIKDVRASLELSEGELRVYRSQVAGAELEWQTARENSADAFAEEAMAVARTSNKTQVEAADARLRVDTLKWAARMRNPKAYSDKQALDVNVRTVDLTRIIQDANARLAASRVIEGHVVRQAIAAPLPDELL
jgi:hypothetical protein